MKKINKKNNNTQSYSKKNTNNIEIYEFLYQEQCKLEQSFFERARNCDVKLGFIIALISGLIIYFISNNYITNIISKQWIIDNGLIQFVFLFILDLAIGSILVIALIFALIGIKTKKPKY